VIKEVRYPKPECLSLLFFIVCIPTGNHPDNEFSSAEVGHQKPDLTKLVYPFRKDLSKIDKDQPYTMVLIDIKNEIKLQKVAKNKKKRDFNIFFRFFLSIAA